MFAVNAMMPSSAPAPASPLGRYADFVTAIVSVVVIMAAIASRMGIGTPDPFTDSIALIAIGVLYGTARGVSAGQQAITTQLADRGNLNTELALAAHKRLDAVNAPPAPLNSTGLKVGDPPDKVTVSS